MIAKLLSFIPLKRLLLYLMILGLLPLFAALFLLQRNYEGLNELRTAFGEVQEMSRERRMKEATSLLAAQVYGGADPFYLDHILEPLELLGSERRALAKLIQESSFTGDELIEKRYAHLLSHASRLQFTEGAVATGGGIHETKELLARPVEIDTEDLKIILESIEGKGGNKPQLMITDLRLVRKATPLKNEVFELNLALLKREFSPCAS